MNALERITQNIIAAIESGAGAWMPWHTTSGNSFPINAATNKLYNGMNMLGLLVSATENGFTCSQWGTFLQWKQLGAHVKAGETGTQILVYQQRDNDEVDANGNPTKRTFLRYATVFNADQVSNWEPPKPAVIDLTTKIAEIDSFIANTRATIKEADVSCPRINTTSSIISMPHRSRYVGSSTVTPTEAYYGDLFHELTHWILRPTATRLLPTEGDFASYEFEELVAELGAAALCAQFGIAKGALENHASYIDNWLRMMRGDSNTIVQASRIATKAVAALNEAVQSNLSSLAA